MEHTHAAKSTMKKTTTKVLGLCRDPEVHKKYILINIHAHTYIRTYVHTYIHISLFIHTPEHKNVTRKQDKQIKRKSEIA